MYTYDTSLVLAVLVGRFLLVQCLERTAVSVVELPRLVHGNPHELRLLQDMPQAANRTLLDLTNSWYAISPLSANCRI